MTFKVINDLTKLHQKVDHLFEKKKMFLMINQYCSLRLIQVPLKYENQIKEAEIGMYDQTYFI